MPLRSSALIIVVLAAAAVIYLALSRGLPGPEASKPLFMHGGVRTESELTTEVASAIDASSDRRIHLVVQFERLLTPAEERALESRFGIDIQEAMPVDAYVVSFPTGRAPGILEELTRSTPASLGAFPIRPADKLSPAMGEPGSIVVPAEYAFRSVNLGEEVLEGVGVILHFFTDTSVDDFGDMFELIDIRPLEGRPPRVSPAPPASVNRYKGVNRSREFTEPVTVVIPLEQIDDVLQIDAVRWIELIPEDAMDDLGTPVAPPGVPAITVPPGPNTSYIGAREAAGYTGQPGGGAGTLIAQWEGCQPRFRAPNAHPALADGPGLVNRIVEGNPVPRDCEPPPLNGDYPPGWHATMVAGIMIGSSMPGSYANYYGMATKAKLRSYNLDYWRTDLRADYHDAIQSGATISQNSWGDGCSIFTRSLEPFYRWQSSLYDQVVSQRTYQGAPSPDGGRMLVITSAGNHGDEKMIPSLWGSARIANSAKNVITVGNVNTQSVTEPDHWAHVSSGRGPTADGRITPVLSAPGIRLNMQSSQAPANRFSATPAAPAAPGGIFSTFPESTYKDEWGTSFSAPIVSGAAALLSESYRNTCSAEPSPTSLRALLIHTAHDLVEAYSTLGSVTTDGSLDQDNCDFSDALSRPFLQGLSQGSEFLVQPNRVYRGPDYIYGFGLVQTDRAIDFAEKSHFLEGEISGGYAEYRVSVDATTLADDAGNLRVTLVWDDPPWPVNSVPDLEHGLLQNDLDLELISPSGKRHLPWVLDPANPAEPAKQHIRRGLMPVTPDLRDHRNTMEQVAVGQPEPGEWKIRVRGGHMVRPPQSFTLVSSAIVPAGNCAGLQPRIVERPVELPDSWLAWWIFWLAIGVLALLIISLLWLIWDYYRSP